MRLVNFNETKCGNSQVAFIVDADQLEEPRDPLNSSKSARSPRGGTEKNTSLVSAEGAKNCAKERRPSAKVTFGLTSHCGTFVSSGGFQRTGKSHSISHGMSITGCVMLIVEV